jgi:predicted cupin superfamily sugar epimerase
MAMMMKKPSKTLVIKTSKAARDCSLFSFFVLMSKIVSLSAADYISALKLEPHPEGGFYSRTYVSDEQLPAASLPARFGTDRSISTAIYFLLEGSDYSAFHRIKSDELWHFYTGGGLHIYVIHPDGSGEVLLLGNDLTNGYRFQQVVKAGCWFASKPASENSFSLVGCTVAPGFDFADFEMASKEQLLQQYPQHQQWIQELCR